MISQRSDRFKEFYRKKFNKRARRGKCRWFALAISRADGKQRLWLNPAAGRLLCRLLWLLCGCAAIWMSWYLLFCTIEVHGGRTERIYREGAEAERRDLEELWQSDGWEREIFGVQLRVRDGKITIFRERQQAAEESRP